MINELVKFSNHLDELGLTEEANFLDAVIKQASLKKSAGTVTMDQWTIDLLGRSISGFRENMDTKLIEDWREYSNLILTGLREATKAYNDEREKVLKLMSEQGQ